ncbi:hypothetical protein QCA50_020640 [Cerrena zonata]|uniref:Uncharacterized protein n=1 Tax=Cerrena zonata TaxID=2478898 RepID=A0AAW0FGK4_9APHY
MCYLSISFLSPGFFQLRPGILVLSVNDVRMFRYVYAHGVYANIDPSLFLLPLIPAFLILIRVLLLRLSFRLRKHVVASFHLSILPRHTFPLFSLIPIASIPPDSL